MKEQFKQNIHWFPGHMKKAQNEISEKIKLVDIVIEILDARIPFSSRNFVLARLTNTKKRIVVLNKKDLADLQYFDEKTLKINDDDLIISTDLKSNKSYELILNAIKEISKEKHEKDIKKGLKPQLLKAMIIGIPNVGKSSFINYVSRKNSAPVGNVPGFTKGNKWIKVDGKFYLLDTPGILPPNYDDENSKINLALIGSIKSEILPKEFLANKILDIIKEKYLNQFNDKYGVQIEKTMQNLDIFDLLCKKRGFLLKNNLLDHEKCIDLILNDFKNGKICKVFLDDVRI